MRKFIIRACTHATPSDTPRQARNYYSALNHATRLSGSQATQIPGACLSGLWYGW
ncbi:unnamed protein product [Prunus brigantina]